MNHQNAALLAAINPITFVVSIVAEQRKLITALLNPFCGRETLDTVNPIVSMVKEQQKLTTPLLEPPLYQLLGRLQRMEMDNGLEEEEKSQQLLSLINNFLAQFVASFAIQANNPLLWGVLAARLFDIIITTMIAKSWLSSSTEELQVVRSRSFPPQPQIQELNHKVDKVMSLFEKNKYLISETTFYKTRDNFWIYAEPHGEVTIISVLPKNEIVSAISPSDQWVQIQFPNYVSLKLGTGWVQQPGLEVLEMRKPSAGKKEISLVTLFQQSPLYGLELDLERCT